MATDTELLNAGFALPSDTDNVSNGDDAIRQNADAAFEHTKATVKAEVDTVRPRVIPTGTDLDAMTGSEWHGRWSVSSQARLDTLVNAPSWMTSGDVIEVQAGIGFQIVYRYTNGGAPHLYYRGRTSSGGVFSEWVKITPPTPALERYGAGYAAHGHAVRAGFALRKLGGTVGTAGRAALALRFDDNPAAFRDKVLPVLREFNLPGYIASATRYYAETAVAYSDVQTWALNDGVSVANHTKTHADASGDEAIWDNTVGAADELEDAMPALDVDVWTMPSMSGTKMDGYDDGRYIGNFVDTTAGRAIMGRHAVVNGYSGGRFQPLIGRPTPGQTHLTFEAMTVTEFKSYVDEAAAAGVGLTLMAHPSRIDTAGYLTAADFRACLEYVAQLRDAGELLVLSPLALGFADAGHGNRHDMLPAGTFPAGPSSSLTTATVALSPNLSQRGASLELVAVVDGPAGAVFRTAVTHTGSGLSATADHTLPAAGPRQLHKPLTLPKTLPYDASLEVTAGTVSGGPVTVHSVYLRAV